jgi:hypothetical protein
VLDGVVNVGVVDAMAVSRSMDSHVILYPETPGRGSAESVRPVPPFGPSTVVSSRSGLVQHLDERRPPPVSLPQGPPGARRTRLGAPPAFAVRLSGWTPLRCPTGVRGRDEPTTGEGFVPRQVGRGKDAG